MSTVTISPDFKIELPEEIRQSLHLKVGQQLAIVEHGDVFALVPVVPVAEMQGIFPGLDTTVERDEDRF